MHHIKFSHAVLLSGTIVPAKSAAEIMSFYRPNVSYVAMWDNHDISGEFYRWATHLYFDCGGCTYALDSYDMTSTDKLFRRPGPKILENWQAKVRAGTISHFEEECPIKKGSQFKALAYNVLYDALLGENSNVFHQYVDYFDSTFIPDEHLWATYLKHEVEDKNRFPMHYVSFVVYRWNLLGLGPYLTYEWLEEDCRQLHFDLEWGYLRNFPVVINYFELFKDFVVGQITNKKEKKINRLQTLSSRSRYSFSEEVKECQRAGRHCTYFIFQYHMITMI
eukprot:Awhi_evm1s58